MKDIRSTKEEEISIRELVDQYVRYWYLFVLGIVVALTIALIYLRYVTTTYQSIATVIIKDEKNGGVAAELAAFSDLGGFLNRFGNNKIENELAIFNSRRIIYEVVKALELNVVYESVGTIKGTEVYNNKPFLVQYLSINDTLSSGIVPKLFIEVNSDTQISLEVENSGMNNTYNFGDKISLPFGSITVFPSEKEGLTQSSKGKLFSVTYSDPGKIASIYQNRIQVINEIKNSNVVVLSMESSVPAKAEDFIDELIYQYNKDAINDRGQVAKKTSDFIDSRLSIITRELDSVEGNKEVFKSENRLTNIEAQAQLVLETAGEYERKQFDISTQLGLANSMIDYMEHTSANELLPGNIGLEGEELMQSVTNYNSLILHRNKLLKSSTAKNPVIVNINQQLVGLRENIINNLKNKEEALRLAMKELNFQEASLNSKLSKVPTQEKIYRGIERQQSIKEQLYLFLLQQREQASISLAVTSPKAKVVDNAFTPVIPVAPNKPLIYLGAGMAGFLLPFLFLYTRRLLNNKIINRKDIERILPQLNIIGEIPKLKKEDSDLIQSNDRSILAEAFRILRTNLQYLFINKLDSSKTANSVFVTSTIKGEGKTFVAFNLALTVALTGKRVVLVGADIRNPQLHRYLPAELRQMKGLTEYIVDNDLNVNEITAQSVENKNLSIVLSGAIPPNPAELLMSSRTQEFFSEIKKHYDFVVVDTAPAMLVADTILINKYADVTLYVVRANYTEKRLLEFVSDAIDDERLNNVALVLNGVSMNNFGYGNKYGYSYVAEKKSFFKSLFNG
jgi:tyrosine-protein kinase Etk/Wzc